MKTINKQTTDILNAFSVSFVSLTKNQEQTKNNGPNTQAQTHTSWLEFK